MFGGIGTGEIIILLVIALIVIGPKKLPEVARTIGRGLAELRRASYDLQRTLTLEELDYLAAHHTVPDPSARERLNNETAKKAPEMGGTPRDAAAATHPPYPDDTHGDAGLEAAPADSDARGEEKPAGGAAEPADPAGNGAATPLGPAKVDAPTPTPGTTDKEGEDT